MVAFNEIEFEWDSDKDTLNQIKHGISFDKAADAFADEFRVIEMDIVHSEEEPRYFCYGLVDGGVMTVRFTYRSHKIRIFGAAYWRAGRKKYEEENVRRRAQ
jgi:uncharacterized DUF497 family protein